MIAFDTPPRSAGRADKVLTAVPQPLFVLEADRRLVLVNPAARRLFADGRAREMAQRLMILGQLDANKLEDLLRCALAGGSAQAALWFSPALQTGWISLSALLPNIALAADWPDTCLLLMVHIDRPELTQSARVEALCRHCRLTSTERYVLMLLADGQAVEAVATQLGMRISTLRTHIRHLLDKTQAPSLMQLLRKLGSAAPLGQLNA